MSSQDEDRLTDKKITDTILLHYCQCLRVDPADQNRDLWVYDFTNKRWLGGTEAESDILKLLGDIFGAEDSHAKFNLEKIKLFIISQVLNKISDAQDLPPYVIAFKNCLLPIKNFIVYNDLHYSEFYPAMEPIEKQPKWFWMNEIPWDYDPEATCPKWLEFLSQIHYKEDLDYDQEWWGYHLHRARPQSIFTILFGIGSNGKTVEIRVMKRVFGPKNYTEISIQELCNSPWGAAQLYHKLANISDDLPNFPLKSLGVLRKASGDSGLSGQFKFGQLFDFDPYAKITYACNELPEFKEDVEANWDRLRVLRYDQRFSNKSDEIKAGALPAKNREELVAELSEEIPGIINWMLDGYQRLLNNDFCFSYNYSTKEIRKFYKSNANSGLAFKEECMQYTGESQHYILKAELPGIYRSWCKANKIKKILNDSEFFQLLKNEGMETVQPRSLNRQRVYSGWNVVLTTLSPSHSQKVTLAPTIEFYNNEQNIESACDTVTTSSPALNGDKGTAGVVVGSSDPEVPASPPMISCVFLMQEPFHGECGICHEKTLLTHFMTDRLEPDKEVMVVCSQCAAFKENQEMAAPK